LNEGTIASIFITIENRQNNELTTIHHAKTSGQYSSSIGKRGFFQPINRL